MAKSLSSCHVFVIVTFSIRAANLIDAEFSYYSIPNNNVEYNILLFTAESTFCGTKLSPIPSHEANQ